MTALVIYLAVATIVAMIYARHVHDHGHPMDRGNPFVATLTGISIGVTWPLLLAFIVICCLVVGPSRTLQAFRR